MDGVAYGLGVGLQATPDTARTLYLNEQRRQQAKEQRALQLRLKEDEQFNAITQKLVMDDNNYKWHRLLVEEAKVATAQTLDKMLEAKNSGGYDYRNAVARIQTEHRNKISELITLNESYKAFEDVTEKVNAGGLYTTRNIQKASDAFRNAKDRTDLESKMLQYGVQSDPYFVFDKDKGYVLPSLVGKIDIIKTLKEDVKATPLMVSFKYEGMTGGGKKQTIIKRQALTRAEAEEALKTNPLLAQNSEFASLEDIAENRLSNPDFKFQFVDTYGLEGKSDDELKETLLELMKPMAGYKASVNVKQPSRGINIYNNTGQTNQEVAAFDPDVYDGYAGVYMYTDKQGNKQSKETFVTGIGMVNTPLKWGQSVKPASAVYIDGKSVGQTTLKDANFSGITAIAYYMQDGKKVPINKDNQSNMKIAGVDMFVMLELNQGTAFIPYERTFLTSAAQSGNQNEKFAVLNGAQKMKQMVELTNKTMGTPPSDLKQNAAWIENWRKTFISKK